MIDRSGTQLNCSPQEVQKVDDFYGLAIVIMLLCQVLLLRYIYMAVVGIRKKMRDADS